jgi:hypothetical protein
MAVQCVVARLPWSRPAAPHNRAPVQTEKNKSRARCLLSDEIKHRLVVHERFLTMTAWN